jgi:GNAT superfamily N-acetyltransferase
MRESDLHPARRILRLAFGTFIGAPDPENFRADRDYVTTRFRANPDAALVAEAEDTVAGSNFATRWGSFGFFGPLTVHPERWNQGIAQALLAATMDLLATWNVKAAGLFTFAHSPKHIALYQRYDFWPGFLIAMMSKTPLDPRGVAGLKYCDGLKYSEVNSAGRSQALDACRDLTGRIFEGLDVTCEIISVHEQRLGETVLVWGGDLLDGFAVCHCGEGTEAGARTCYIKFAAVRPGAGAERRLEHLLAACEALALEKGMERMEAGVNTGRVEAYRSLLRHGYRTDAQGVAMHRPPSPAYNRPDVYVVDDWR